jgi:cbb3-type cytochrome oxidase maturation protein
MIESWDSILLILIFFGFLFFCVAVFALYWAAKNGQFEAFEKGSKVIFDEDEPEGVQTDHFPKKKRSTKGKP